MKDDSQAKLSRRRMFAAGGTVGALAAVAAALPGTKVAPSAPVPVAKDDPADKGGYQVTDHVLRYYKTARV